MPALSSFQLKPEGAWSEKRFLRKHSGLRQHSKGGRVKTKGLERVYRWLSLLNHTVHGGGHSCISPVSKSPVSKRN